MIPEDEQVGLLVQELECTRASGGKRGLSQQAFDAYILSTKKELGSNDAEGGGVADEYTHTAESFNFNLYEALGTAPNSNLHAIKQAIRRKRLRFHPDKGDTSEAAKVFLANAEAAFLHLSDEKRGGHIMRIICVAQSQQTR